MNKPTNNAVIYCRTNVINEKDNSEIIRHQEAVCRAYAEQKGFTTTNVFHDVWVSGVGPSGKAFNDLLQYCQQPENAVSAVIVTNYSRISRDLCALVHVVQKLQTFGISIYGVSEGSSDLFFKVIKPDC